MSPGRMGKCTRDLGGRSSCSVCHVLITAWLLGPEAGPWSWPFAQGSCSPGGVCSGAEALVFMHLFPWGLVPYSCTPVLSEALQAGRGPSRFESWVSGSRTQDWVFSTVCVSQGLEIRAEPLGTPEGSLLA